MNPSASVRPPVPPSETPSLADLIEELTNQLQAGEAVDLQACAAKYPQHASAIRELLPALQVLGEMSGSAAPGPEPSESAPGTEPRTLGDFRILREVGRGGMGVVYEAEQISLGRRVALKVLPFAATMDPRQLQRFHNEARAAAGLHHTNIVPVFGVGSERGVHYYAMQFIDGRTLAGFIEQQRGAALAQMPTGSDSIAASASTVRVTGQVTSAAPRDAAYFRRIAEWGIQAAEALDCAHAVGIVHRDVKPANLLVDTAGRLWVTDFGLAQVQSDTRLTMSGDLVGTLRYMSPEQALAKRVVIDHRTDIYSLGATLYELLTLQPVLDGSDRQELLRQIAFEEPKAARQINKAIPPELETIVLKALEKRPQDRYATAQDVADDLRRWLLDEPIRARRPRLRARLGRWCRRHKPAVAGVTAALLMGLAVLGGSIGWVARDQEARRAKNLEIVAGAMEDTRTWQQRRRLPEALWAARRADALLAETEVDESLRESVRARRADLELLDRLEDIRLETMIADTEGEFDRKGADSLYGQTFREAGLNLEELPVEESAERIRNSTVPVEICAVLDHWAWVRMILRGPGDSSWRHLLRVARAADPDALRTQVRVTLETGDRSALLKIVASGEVFHLAPVTLDVLGTALLAARENRAEAEAFLREAQRRHPNDFWLNGNLCSFFWIVQPHQVEECTRFATVAVALRPVSPVAHLNLGSAFASKGRLDEAIAAYVSAIRLRKDYSLAHNNLGLVLSQKGRVDDAIAEYQEAIRINPNDAMPHHNLGYDLYAKGRINEAITEYREAIRLKPDYAKAHLHLGVVLVAKHQFDDGIAEYRSALRVNNDYPEAHYNIGVALQKKGCVDEAIKAYQQALQFKKDFVEAHFGLALALQNRRQWDEAIAEYQEAIRIDKDHAQAHCNLGTCLQKKGQLDQAMTEYREAIRLNKDNAEAHYNLGTCLEKKRRLPEALAAHREAIRLNERFAEPHCSVGLILQGQGHFGEALVELKRGHELRSRKGDWAYPSETWITDTERLAELDARLPGLLKGESQPADADERVAFARLCQRHKKRYAAAAGWYAEAFAAKPSLGESLSTGYRYDAACAAALASAGEGLDAHPLDDKDRTRLRKQALDWLKADLELWRGLLEKESAQKSPVVAPHPALWPADTDFAGVHGDKALAALPLAERLEWRKLWEDVEALRQRAARSAE
jgi:tetratricopeptide (TPR) repeat protein